MNEKQRIKDCIHFKAIDRIPWQINYTTELGSRMMKALNIKIQHYSVLGKNIYTYTELDDYLGNHLAFIRNRAVNSFKEIEPGLLKDEWNVIWDRRIDKDIGTPVNCVLENMDLKKLKIPDPDDESRYAHFEPAIKVNQDRYILVKFSFSLFERAWSMRGMENLMIDFIKNPSFVHELLDAITDFNLAVFENLKRYRIDGAYFGDDWGCQRGLLISPGTWREFIKPRLKRMYDQAHRQGYDVFIHSCGNITSILDDLIEIGVNVYNPFQPEVIDIQQIINDYSKRLAFYGGLSIQDTLPFGNPADVRREVEHRLGLALKYGGYIISPSHDMPPDIPLENILSMLTILKDEPMPVEL